MKKALVKAGKWKQFNARRKELSAGMTQYSQCWAIWKAWRIAGAEFPESRIKHFEQVWLIKRRAIAKTMAKARKKIIAKKLEKQKAFEAQDLRKRAVSAELDMEKMKREVEETRRRVRELVAREKAVAAREKQIEARREMEKMQLEAKEQARREALEARALRLEREMMAKIEKRREKIEAKIDKEEAKLSGAVVVEGGGGGIDIVRDVSWVYENFGRLIVVRDNGERALNPEVIKEAPSQGACALATYALQDSKAFFDKYVCRLFPKDPFAVAEERSGEEGEGKEEDLDPGLDEISRWISPQQ